MGSSLSTKLKVGVTTVIAVILLFGGTLWVKQYNPLQARETMRVVFVNSKGVTAGDPVTVSGIKVGEVAGVELSPENRAIIRFTVNGSLHLKSDCKFYVEDVGLMGDKALVIDPGANGAEIDHAALQVGTETTGLNDLIAGADQVMGKLNRIGDMIENDLDLAALITSFQDTSEKLREAIDIYQKLAEENREPLKRSIAGLEASTGELREFIQTANPKLDSTLDSFRTTSDKLSVALDNIENLTTVVDTLSFYVDNGEGTLGKLIKSGALYDELRQTNANIDAFILDFKKNPGKYTKDMNFKIRLF